MKKMLYVIAFCMPFSVAKAADTGLSPNSLKLKVYKFAVSTSPLCTDLITVVDNGATPLEVDFVGTVNIGSGTLADGTYPCVVVEMSDNIKYVPSSTSTSNHCVSGVESTSDVCSSGTSKLIDGTTTTCTAGDNKVAMYLSTASTSTTNSDAFTPPTSVGDASRGFQLAAALAISGSASGKFVANASGKVCDRANGSCEGGGGTTCAMQPPLFSFTKL